MQIKPKNRYNNFTPHYFLMQYLAISHFLFFAAYGMANKVNKLPENPIAEFIEHHTPAKMVMDASIS